MLVSRNPNGIDIPWILIILLFMSGAWPIGLILLILRELPIGKVPAQTSATAASQSAPKKKASAKKKKDSKFKSGKAGVFRTVGIILKLVQRLDIKYPEPVKNRLAGIGRHLSDCYKTA